MILLTLLLGIVSIWYLPLSRANLASRSVPRAGPVNTMVGEGAGAPAAGERSREKRRQERRRKTVWNNIIY